MDKFLNRTTFLVSFAYDGSKFYGVQEQPHLDTVLGKIRASCSEIAGQPVRGLAVATRTDRGVHAFKNIATFYFKEPLKLDDFKAKFFKLRLENLYFLNVQKVCNKTHARTISAGKIYRYFIKDNQSRITDNEFHWCISPKLDIIKMQQGAKALIGAKDFSSFQGGGKKSFKNPNKTIYSIDISRLNNDQIILIQINGSSFLRYMVRNMVGLLSEIGAGLKEPSCVEKVLAAKSRSAAGITAPPQGLYLVEVLLNKLLK